MSEKPSTVPSAEDERELDEIAEELYGLRPDDFAAVRDEQVRKARADGRQPLARELAKLRRPTQSAWLINLLWRDQPEVVEQFLELGDELSRAQAEASGAELHRLTAMRRGLEAALVRAARGLAEHAGVSVSATMEREAQETLAAALARPEVAAEVRTGRLVKPASYAGFGTVVSTPAPPTSRPPSQRKEPVAADSEPGTSAKPEDLQALVAEKRARERREAAERRVSEARAAVEAAADALAEQERAAGAADLRQRESQELAEKLQEQLRALQEQLSDARKGIVSAEREVAASAARRDQAQKTHAAALQALARAEQALADDGPSS
jgi:predicted ribosome quality control (RQC) complex YloA/Tae2 family protein